MTWFSCSNSSTFQSKVVCRGVSGIQRRSSSWWKTYPSSSGVFSSLNQFEEILMLLSVFQIWCLCLLCCHMDLQWIDKNIRKRQIRGSLIYVRLYFIKIHCKPRLHFTRLYKLCKFTEIKLELWITGELLVYNYLLQTSMNFSLCRSRTRKIALFNDWVRKRIIEQAQMIFLHSGLMTKCL